MFFEKSEKIFRGFFKRRKPQKGGLGVATPTRFPQDKIERLAKFGTVVESCSKKLRCVVSSFTIQLSGAGLLRSGEKILWNLPMPSTDGAGILLTLRKHFSL